MLTSSLSFFTSVLYNLYDDINNGLETERVIKYNELKANISDTKNSRINQSEQKNRCRKKSRKT